MEDIKAEWYRVLRLMLERYRKQNPQDKRGDLELLDSLMKHFVEHGVIRERGGKYLLGRLDDPEWLLRVLSDFRN